MCASATSSIASSSTAIPAANASTAPNPASLRPQRGNRKLNKLQAKRKDDILRRAIEMYHLTPHFLPTPDRIGAVASSSSKSTNLVSDAEYEAALDSEICSSILNANASARNLPIIVPRGLNEFSRDISNRAASTPSFGSTSDATMQQTRDIQAWGSDLTQSTFPTRKERDAAAAAKKKAGKSDARSSSNAATLEAFTDADLEMYQRRHSHGGASADAARHSGAERMSHLNRIIPGNNQWYKNQGLDSRSARVRDAIFGTVNGELPGLEVVRERIAKIKQEKKSA
ncbi:hypothetical protein ACQY0O_003361 [Thecaphora frezii]